jgi:ferredoxin-type protein NapG
MNDLIECTLSVYTVTQFEASWWLRSQHLGHGWTLLKLSRRRFLGMAVSFSAVTGLAAVADVIPSHSLVRPAGAVSEDQFLESCIRCGACAEVCPVSGIEIAHITDGLRNMGTPALAVPDRYCMIFKGLEYPSVSKGYEKEAAQAAVRWKNAHGADLTKEELCSECIQVCPTDALQLTDLSQFHLGTAVVYKEYCLAWMFGHCTFPCMDACLFDAISVTAGPVVDAEKCVGCNQCSYVCASRLLLGSTGIVVEPTPRRAKT